MITEKQYYAMSDRERDAWVAETFLVIAMPSSSTPFEQLSDKQKRQLHEGIVFPDHRDANTVMAVIRVMKDGGWDAHIAVCGTCLFLDWCCFDTDKSSETYEAEADKLHDAVYLAAGKALKVVE